MTYTKKFSNEKLKNGKITMKIEQWNKNLWVARNPRLNIGYTASTYEKVVERVEEKIEAHPENFIEKTDAEMRGMTEEEYQAMKKLGRKIVAEIKGEYNE